MTNRFHETLAILHSVGIFDILAPYTPVFAGTIPLGIDIPSSDADIICNTRNDAAFVDTLYRYFSQYNTFTLRHTEKYDIPSIVASFEIQLEVQPRVQQEQTVVQVEIFGQNVDVWEQNAVRHLLVEYRLLELGSPHARVAIRALKQQGIKTEPAFAQYYNLAGDPYLTLLQLFYASDDELVSVMTNNCPQS